VSEASFLALDAFCKGFECLSRSVSCWWYLADFVVEVGCDMILEEFPQVFDDDFWRACVDVFEEALVDSDDVPKFVGEVIFAAFSCFEGDARSDSDRWYWEDGEDHPFWSRVCWVEAEFCYVFVCYSVESGVDIDRCESFFVFEESGWFF